MRVLVVVALDLADKLAKAHPAQTLGLLFYCCCRNRIQGRIGTGHPHESNGGKHNTTHRGRVSPRSEPLGLDIVRGTGQLPAVGLVESIPRPHQNPRLPQDKPPTKIQPRNTQQQTLGQGLGLILSSGNGYCAGVVVRPRQIILFHIIIVFTPLFGLLKVQFPIRYY